jgi:hypothetical protein
MTVHGRKGRRFVFSPLSSQIGKNLFRQPLGVITSTLLQSFYNNFYVKKLTCSLASQLHVYVHALVVIFNNSQAYIARQLHVSETNLFLP